MHILLVSAFISTIINMLTEEDKSIGKPTPCNPPSSLPIAWIEGAAIFLAVAICTLVAAVNDYEKEKQFVQLNKVADDKKQVEIKPAQFWSDFPPRSPSSGMEWRNQSMGRSSSAATSSKSRRE